MHSINGLSSRGHTFLVFNIITPVVACIAVLLRLWIRSFISKSIGTEDMLLGISMILYVGASVTAVVMALYGFGGHLDAISNENRLVLFKSMFANGVFIYLCVIALRSSICLLFLRITHVRWHRIILYSIAVTTTIITLVNLFRINIIYCTPVSLYWDTYVGVSGGTCVSAQAMSILLYIQYIISAAADWITSLLPVFIMRDWVFHKQGKIATYGLLGMGIFASGAAIAAVVINPTAADTGDYTYTAFGIFLAQGLEPFIGLLAASFATYRPLFQSLSGIISKKPYSESDDGSPTASSQAPMVSNGFSFIHEPV